MKAKILAAAFGILALCPLAATAQHDTRDPWQEALNEYEIGHYREAISWLSIAGENNDVRAQQMLGLMYVYGESLYGAAVPRDVGLARSWLYRAEAQGSGVARYALARLDSGQPVPPAVAIANREASGE
jgi:TPR repeat protein